MTMPGCNDRNVCNVVSEHMVRLEHLEEDQAVQRKALDTICSEIKSMYKLMLSTACGVAVSLLMLAFSLLARR